MRPHKSKQAGFTLIELIMVMVITGIIASVVAIFMKTPVDQYLDIARRAEMTDIADTALHRMARDIRTAVPNSVRLSGDKYIEFLPTKAGGRYRANATGSNCSAVGNTENDALSFISTDTCFEILGPTIDDFATDDQIVVGSTQSDGNLPYQDPSSATSIRRTYSSDTVIANTQIVVITSSTPLPGTAKLEGYRFEVVPGEQKAITYACENIGGITEGTGTLTRYWAYGFNAAQVTPPFTPPSGGLSALLADKISDCSIAYNTTNQRNGLLAITLTIMSGGESISLYQEIHVNNTP